MGVEQVMAVLVAAVCLALLVRLALGPQRRARLDRWAVRQWHAFSGWCQRRWQVIRYGRTSKRQAQQVVHDLMQRSRQPGGSSGDGAPRPRVQRDGNVYMPERFKDASRAPKAPPDDPV
jgi:hypothetical protein